MCNKPVLEKIVFTQSEDYFDLLISVLKEFCPNLVSVLRINFVYLFVEIYFHKKKLIFIICNLTSNLYACNHQFHSIKFTDVVICYKVCVIFSA